MSESPAQETVQTQAQFREHWQGHRRVTRKTIEAFPEKDLFEFTIGGMRPFGEMVQELLNMAEPTLKGVITDKWESFIDRDTRTKAYLLEKWDETTRIIDDSWSDIPEGKFQERANAFGQFEGPVHALFFYIVDNEIHHRAQGIVYLRALGLEPPLFFERD